MITKNAWSQSNRSKRYNILVLSIAILREVCKGAQIPSKSLPDSCQIFPRAGKHASLDAFNEGMLTVIFVFARRYFVSLKSCPLLFLLLAEVVFFFCEVITKLILGTCAWAWAWTHDGEKIGWFVHRSSSIPKLIKEKKEHHERHAARDPRHFSCECFFCVNDYVIMKIEIRAARALAWRLLGLVTQHSEKCALRDQSK